MLMCEWPIAVESCLTGQNGLKNKRTNSVEENNINLNVNGEHWEKKASLCATKSFEHIKDRFRIILIVCTKRCGGGGGGGGVCRQRRWEGPGGRAWSGWCGANRPLENQHCNTIWGAVKGRGAVGAQGWQACTAPASAVPWEP